MTSSTLWPGKLAALAGLGALGHLDLQLVGVDQVVGGHAEAAGGHLLDGAAARVAVRRRAGSARRPRRPRRCSTAPPMRFMAMASVSCASLLIEPNDMAPVAKRFTISAAGSTSSSGTGCARLAELEQAAQRAEVPALVVDQVGVLLERRVALAAAPRAAACRRSAGCTGGARRATRYW